MSKDLEIGKIMYEKALQFINQRYPHGWGGCAVMYTKEEIFLISVYLESPNSSAELCMETGAMCEAQKQNLHITHSLCLSRDNEFQQPKILTPCGICQERLFYWGETVQVAITNCKNEIIFKTLKELNPHYWHKAFTN